MTIEAVREMTAPGLATHGFVANPSVQLRGLEPVGWHAECDGDVYTQEDGGACLALCERCGRGWRIGVVLVIESLNESEAGHMYGGP